MAGISFMCAWLSLDVLRGLLSQHQLRLYGIFPNNIGGGSHRVALRVLFQPLRGTRIESPTVRKPAGYLPVMN